MTTHIAEAAPALAAFAAEFGRPCLAALFGGQSTARERESIAGVLDAAGDAAGAAAWRAAGPRG